VWWLQAEAARLVAQKERREADAARLQLELQRALQGAQEERATHELRSRSSDLPDSAPPKQYTERKKRGLLSRVLGKGGKEHPLPPALQLRMLGSAAPQRAKAAALAKVAAAVESGSDPDGSVDDAVVQGVPLWLTLQLACAINLGELLGTADTEIGDNGGIGVEQREVHCTLVLVQNPPPPEPSIDPHKALPADGRDARQLPNSST